MLGLPYLYVTVGPELDEIITKQLGIGTEFILIGPISS